MIIHVQNLDDVRLLENKMMNEYATVVFYFMEGCFHCDNMKPAWHKFEKMYENDENNTIAMIESNHIQHLENKPDIIGFPTIIKYKNNNPIEYSGDRSTKSFKIFANIKSSKKSKSKPKSKPKAKSKTKSKTKPKIKSKAKAKSKSKTKTKPKSRKSSKPKSRK